MQTNFIWGTDIHLDFLDRQGDSNVQDWIDQNIKPKEGDAIILTGDISLGPSVINHLRMIQKTTQKNVYFVLGNHDYWDTSVGQLRSDIVHLKAEGIVWLGGVDYIPFGEKIALLGHDGWYDALNGNAKRSRFVMQDWFRIQEFLNLQDLISTARKLAADGAAHVEASCVKAIEDGRDNLVILTHFPPFAEACLYRGQPANDNSLPWYSSKLMGEALISLAEKYQNVRFTVLCGHTHSFVDISPRPNLRVVVGDSDYGSPNSTTIGVTE